MNVTAFIRKTSAKDKATIYFRVRGEKCDIKCASELTINPNHWDAKRQSYKQRIALVKDSERQQLNDAILDLKRLISKEYYIGTFLSRCASSMTARTALLKSATL
jgi:hypothetical protein